MADHRLHNLGGFLPKNHMPTGSADGLGLMWRREAIAGWVATVGYAGLDTVEDARCRLASLAERSGEDSLRRRP